MEPYRHQPIDLSKKAIRLLHLFPGLSSDPIRCGMYMSLLEEDQCIHIEYEALSYTWGSSDTSETIYIEARPFQVTKNLHTALLHLRREDSGRFLWVDAVCIDQSNDEEQGHQVGQMGTVYSSAERVLVWLGPHRPETHFLLGLAKYFHERAVQRQPAKGQSSLELWRLVWEEDMLHEIADPEDPRIRELRRLLDQPWFRRVWVIQEVALARRAEIVCGHASVPASAFALMPSLMGVGVSKRTQALLDVMPGPLRESSRSWWKAERDLGTMLQKFVDSEASRPRDRIYALLGVSSDTSKSGAILPDYQCDEEETVQAVLRFIVFGDHPVPAHVELPRWTVCELLDRMSRSSHRDKGLSIWGHLLSCVLQDNASPALAKHIVHTRLPCVSANVGGPKNPDPILHILIQHYPSSAEILEDLCAGGHGQELDLELTYQGRTAIVCALHLDLLHVAASLWRLKAGGNPRANLPDSKDGISWGDFLEQATGDDRADLLEPLLAHFQGVVDTKTPALLGAPSSENDQIAAFLLQRCLRNDNATPRGNATPRHGSWQPGQKAIYQRERNQSKRIHSSTTSPIPGN